MEGRSVAARIRAERIEAHKQSLMIGKVQSVLDDMNEKQAEIEDCLNQVQNALQLLQPSCNNKFSAKDFSSLEVSQEAKEFSESPVQSTAANNEEGKNFLKSSINLNEESNNNEDPDVDERESQKLLNNSDNAPIIESLRETLGFVRNLLTSVSKWTHVLTTAGNQSDKLKQCIDNKQALARSISNCSKLNISNLQDESKDNSGNDFEEVPENGHCEENVVSPYVTASYSDDSDDDFEEVPKKEHYKENVVSPYFIASNPVKRANSGEQPSCSYKKRIKIRDDPTTSDSNLRNLINKNLFLIRASSSSTDMSLPSTSKIKQETDSKNPQKAKLLSKAPKLHFDAGLLRWDGKLEAPSVINQLQAQVRRALDADAHHQRETVESSDVNEESRQDRRLRLNRERQQRWRARQNQQTLDRLRLQNAARMSQSRERARLAETQARRQVDAHSLAMHSF